MAWVSDHVGDGLEGCVTSILRATWHISSSAVIVSGLTCLLTMAVPPLGSLTHTDGRAGVTVGSPLLTLEFMAVHIHSVKRARSSRQALSLNHMRMAWKPSFAHQLPDDFHILPIGSRFFSRHENCSRL